MVSAAEQHLKKAASYFLTQETGLIPDTWDGEVDGSLYPVAAKLYGMYVHTLNKQRLKNIRESAK